MCRYFVTASMCGMVIQPRTIQTHQEMIHQGTVAKKIINYKFVKIELWRHLSRVRNMEVQPVCISPAMRIMGSHINYGTVPYLSIASVDTMPIKGSYK